MSKTLLKGPPTLHEAISKIYETKWSLTSNFYIKIEPALPAKNTLWSSSGLAEIGDFNLYLKDFQVPQYGSGNPIETFINDRFRMAQSYFDVASINLTFKDFDQNRLYRCFLKYLKGSREKYFDEISFNITVFKGGDNVNEKTYKIMELKKCMLTNVSTLTLSNDNEAQICEFSITLKDSKIPEV